MEVVGGGVGGRSSTPGVGRPGGRHQQRWWGGGSSPLVVVAVVAGHGCIVDVDGAGSGHCHAPNMFGTVNIEHTIDSRLSWSE